MLIQHARRIGDTRTALSVTLKQRDTNGVLQYVDLTGLTVAFEMRNAATGEVKIAETTTGVTASSPTTGRVDYTFSAAGVDTAGVYNATFLVTQSGRADRFPVEVNHLVVGIDSMTQTASEVYEDSSSV